MNTDAHCHFNNQFICLLLAVLIIVTLSSCSKSNSTQEKPSNTDLPSTQEQTTGKNDSQINNNAPNSAETSKLTGKLNIINLDDRDPSVLRGVRIIGNRVGTNEDINGKTSSLNDVRDIFELNEWIEFYPDTDAKHALRVWVVKHRDDLAYYNSCKFSDLMPGFATYCDLHYPEDAEDAANSHWGNFYLNPDDNKPGYYDFVFTYEGKAIAVLLTKFYNEEEIKDKSGSELEALMKESR